MLPVERETLLRSFYSVGVVIMCDRFFFEFHGRVEVAGFGMSSSQGIDVIRLSPAAQVAGCFCVRDRLLSISKGGVGTGGSKPGAGT